MVFVKGTREALIGAKQTSSTHFSPQPSETDINNGVDLSLTMVDNKPLVVITKGQTLSLCKRDTRSSDWCKGDVI